MKKKDLTKRSFKTELVSRDEGDSENFCIQNPSKLSMSFYGSDTIQKTKQIICDFQQQDGLQIPLIQELTLAKSACSTSKQTPKQPITKRKLPSFIQSRTLQKVCNNTNQDKPSTSKQISIHKTTNLKEKQRLTLRKYQSEKQFSKTNKKEQKGIMEKKVSTTALNNTKKKPLTIITQVIPKKISINPINSTNSKIAINTKNTRNIASPMFRQTKPNIKKPTLLS